MATLQLDPKKVGRRIDAAQRTRQNIVLRALARLFAFLKKHLDDAAQSRQQAIRTIQNVRTTAGRNGAALINVLLNDADLDADPLPTDWEADPLVDGALDEVTAALADAREALRRAREEEKLTDRQSKFSFTETLSEEDAAAELHDMLTEQATQAEEAAQIDAAKLIKGGGKLTGARRVVHPEASAGGTCGLCVIASTRVYKTTDLAPIHDHCRCTVLPIITLRNGDEFDPGKVVNDDDLDIPAAFTDANWDTRSRMSNVKFTKGDDGKLHVDENTQPQWYRDGQPDPAKGETTPETQTGGGRGGGGKKPPRDYVSKHDPGDQYRDRNNEPLGFGPRDVRIPENSLRHVLDGEIDSKGRRHGGHTMQALSRWEQEGVSIENLIIFPPSWSDDQIKSSIRMTIDQPDRAHLAGSKLKLDRIVDGVLIRVYVILRKGGPVVLTAAPQRGAGVLRVEQGVLKEVP